MKPGIYWVLYQRGMYLTVLPSELRVIHLAVTTGIPTVA